MRWPPWKEHEEPEDQPTANLKDAEQTRLDADSALEQVRKDTGAARKLAEDLRNLRRRNHFADLIDEALRGDQ